MIYYSAENNGFYSDAVHGSPTIKVIDPEFEFQVPNPDCKIPQDAVEITAEDHSELLAGQASGLRITADDSGYPVLAGPPPVTLDELAAQKRDELDQARDAAFAKGLEYDVDGETDVVQTRPQDQINLLGLNAKATRLITTGNAATLMKFRDLSNVNHWIDAEAMDDLTMAALSHIESIYQQSWERKDALDQAHTAEDREAIEALRW